MCVSFHDRQPLIANVKGAPGCSGGPALWQRAYLLGSAGSWLGSRVLYGRQESIMCQWWMCCWVEGYKDVIVLRIYGPTAWIPGKRSWRYREGVNLYTMWLERDLGSLLNLTDAGREEICCWDILTETYALVWPGRVYYIDAPGAPYYPTKMTSEIQSPHLLHEAGAGKQQENKKLQTGGERETILGILRIHRGRYFRGL